MDVFVSAEAIALIGVLEGYDGGPTYKVYLIPEKFFSKALTRILFKIFLATLLILFRFGSSIAMNV